MTDTMLKLERHRYGNGTQVPVVEFHDRLQAVTVTKDISGKEDIQLSMLGTFEEPQTAFTPGDFVTLRDQTGSTWSWGRVSVVRSQLKRSPSGALTHTPYAVMVQGWYDFLTRSKIHVMLTSSRTKVGTLFNTKEWTDIATAFYNMYGKPPGEMLAYMLRQIVRIKLPESLGGGWFADQIPVVYDRDTALRWAPEFADIEPVSFGTLMPQINSSFLNARSTDVGSLIANMFMFENSLVEIVPYLSVGSGPITTTTPALQGVPQANSPVANAPAPVPVTQTQSGRTALGDILGMQPVIVYRIKPFRTVPLKNSVVSKIVYRPEEVEAGYLDNQFALYDVKTRQALLDERAKARAATTNMLQNNKDLFSQITFNPATMASLPFDIITQMTRQRSDAERVNATTINAVPSVSPAGTTITDVDYLALPITIDNQVEHHGLRLRHARWNLYPTTNNQSIGAGPNDIPYDVYYRSVAAQVMQFYEKAHLYETGSITTHFLHTLYQRPDSTGRPPYTYDRAALGVEPGRWFRTSFEGLNAVREPTPEPPPAGANTAPNAPSDEYYGYITSVTHSVQRLDSGAMAANSQVSFQRGHFAEMWDLLNGLTVPLGEIDTPPGQGGGGGQTRGGGRACSLREALPASELENNVSSVRCDTYALFRPSLATFTKGDVATSWASDPTMYPPIMSSFAGGSGSNDAPALPDRSQYNKIAHNFVPSARPEWLRCWFLEAISVMPEAEYNDVKTVLDANTRLSTQSAYINEAASQEATLWALAACACTIERYWQSRAGYEDVRLRIRSIPRAVEGGYHKLYAAMDFYLEYPANFAGEVAGTFQMWTALKRLADAGRIPYGGRGVYVNVNPSTGITGTAPSEANLPSKTTCQYPPGGSSWTHYDLRAMWGITTKIAYNSKGNPIGASPASFTTWIGTDWNGDGKDELTLGASYPPTKFNALEEAKKGGVADTIEYVFANIADPDFTYLKEYTDPTNKKAQTALAVSAIMRKRRAADPNGDIEKTRVSLRQAVRSYFTAQGASDQWLHAVTNKVPNMFQVFDMEQLLRTQLTPPPQRPALYDLQTAEGDYYFARDASNNIAAAPLIVMLGGARIAGDLPRVYMERYARVLFGSNHVFIAKSDAVDWVRVNDVVLNHEAFDNTGTVVMGDKHTTRSILIFSSGSKVGITYIRATAGVTTLLKYPNIFLADAYLGSNSPLVSRITTDVIVDMKARPQVYRFIYTDDYTAAGNGMTGQTRNEIWNIPNLVREKVAPLPGVLTPDMIALRGKHLSAVPYAIARLRAANLAK